jgi:ATP-dependent Clp protease ATP-binding subunit ClpX
MEKSMKIEGLQWYPKATGEQLEQWKEDLLQKDSGVLLVLPNPKAPEEYVGVLLEQYYTEVLSTSLGVRGTLRETPYVYLAISGLSVRGFMNSVMRRLRPYCPPSAVSEEEELLSSLPELPRQEEPSRREESPRRNTETPIQRFLQTQTPAGIQRQLQEYVIGQEELTRAVADFLYYHGLRQLHPGLPQRPLMISGPSGCGKTEVWRTANKLFGDLFPIRIIDGASLSCEGWSGNYKLDTYIDAGMVDGGILVVDEFDKLTKPKHSSGGDNVSLDMQAEFLKLMEGEYRVTEKRKQTRMTSEKMGFVLVGAFESLRASKQSKAVCQSKPIGFCTQAAQPRAIEQLTDEDFIAYGIMPEIVGRIAVKCEAKPLSDRVYLDIVRGPNSRVAKLTQVLQSYGIAVQDVISNQALAELISSSKANCTGVRWVSAQVESRLLEAIHDGGLRPSRSAS